MIPYIVTPDQARIAEAYFGRSVYELSAADVQEALDWYYEGIQGDPYRVPVDHSDRQSSR